MTSESCRTYVISDEPRSEDAFEGKGHERLSKAIVDLILNSEEGGKVVGLEGDWGAGKSTVVKLVEKGLEPRKEDIAFVFFDAWAHQGDPLRRAFLETCIDELQSKKWIDIAKWGITKDELAKRSKKTETDTSSRLTFLGGLLAFSFVILVPLGPLLINASYQQRALPILGSPVSPASLFSSGFLLALSPLILFLSWFALYNSLRMVFQGFGKLPIRWLATWAARVEKEQFSRSDIFALLAQRYDTTTTTLTTETIDPTSIEFEQKFRELLSEALPVQKRKLVIVLDNLDRTFNDDARSILANLQTFFQHKQGKGSSEFRRTWILIPYDRKGFGAIWKSVNSTDTDNSDVSHEFSDSMLHKRFHLIFPVPPLVVSDLKTYLLSLLGDAFPDHLDQDELHIIYQVIRGTWRSASVKPGKHEVSKATPRELVSLVNRIGAIHRQWCSIIPLSHISFYACRRFLCPDEQIDQELIRKGEFPPAEILLLLGEDIRDNLAALWFNVPVELARQILYQDSVVECLRSEGGAKDLIVLSERTPKLWTVIAEVSNEFQFHFVSLEDCLNAVVQLGSDQLRTLATEAEFRTVIDDLIFTLKKIDAWGPVDKAIAEKFIQLLDIRQDNSLPPLAFRLLASGHGKSAEESYTVETAPGWVDALFALWPVIEDQFETLQSGSLMIPADAPGTLKALSLLHQEDTERKILPRIGLPDNLVELQEAMVQCIDAGNFRAEDIGQIWHISENPVGGTFDWRTVFLRIAERLRAIAKSNNLSEDITGLMQAISQIKLISNSPNLPGAKDYRALVTDGTLYHFVDRFQEEQSYLSLGSLLSLIIQIYPELTSLPEGTGVGRWREGNTYVQNTLFRDPFNHLEVIFELCGDLAKVGKLPLLNDLWIKNSASRKFVSACYIEISKLEQQETQDSRFVFANWREIKANIDDNQKWGDYVEYWVARTSLLQDIIEWDEPIMDDSTIFVDWMLKKGATSNKEFIAWVRNQLVVRSEAEWLTALQLDNGWVSLLVRFKEEKLALNLELDFQRALLTFAEQLAGGATPPKKVPERWATIFGCFGKNKHNRSVLKRDIWRKLIARDGDIAEPFFSYFGEELADRDMIRKEPNSVEQVFRPLLERDSGTGLRWLLSLLNNHPKLLEGYQPQDAVLEFKDRIRKSLSEGQSKYLELIKELAVALEIEVPPSEGLGEQSQEGQA